MSKATRGQALSAPRKRARQRANNDWKAAEAAKLGMTVQQFETHCCQITENMGVPRRVVTVGTYNYEPVRRETAYANW
ncbi:hypothetical protein A2763_00865 [Candidatus Kaiserbacteria bacterium RIFCSPHIGHO2_01_FULL_54_36]|uniref:Uncharacterized protein n=1 Tax=Candidatus Kaiserbacteria bacterium RIFCSPHIGHO2_01_FULL_54_36 TaxID=1798482 RepID=A0A1F6CPD5_9BACT|nr:MAG: hypothetical protein A2763_00865 [Candidatus Kaiserbacteria bacterium RIFCSPHIGHO2_01_FULL_54_36]OGG75576.1 MAG: hypothetical protein A3A41_03070 [Candidatus Kaiserbacteria bacterium RIFCSPLOWO2_01_FULL_54_22]